MMPVKFKTSLPLSFMSIHVSSREWSALGCLTIREMEIDLVLSDPPIPIRQDDKHTPRRR